MNFTMANKPVVVVIGAGFAGAATAWRLALEGARVIVLEREPGPGSHASSQNASMLRHSLYEPEVVALCRETSAFLRQALEEGKDPHLFRPIGSLILGDKAQEEKLMRIGKSLREQGLPFAVLGPRDAARIVPALDGARFDLAVHGSADGLVDIHQLVRLYLRKAAELGAEIRLGTAVQGFAAEDGVILAVQTAREEIPCDSVVNAAGAWCGVIGAMAGAGRFHIEPRRRHLFVTKPLAMVNPDWPFVWHVGRKVYFRPDGQALMISPCDETVVSPGSPRLVDELGEIAIKRVAEVFPAIGHAVIDHGWAGLRTFTDGEHFLVGPDPDLKNFIWCACLGGHGMSTSAGVGRLAAAHSLGLPVDEALAKPFLPGRFASAV
ncbi:MAG: FAD-dependent catabolic D-arginine dehydrogenase DauA [Myxococcota bacterium]|nr:FAD-dependent catabolic D-arginine dehydrogenase DauA [Myxococcota bacterium]